MSEINLQDHKKIKELVADWDFDKFEIVQMHYAITAVFDIITDRIKNGESFADEWSSADMTATADSYFPEFEFNDHDLQVMTDIVDQLYQEELIMVNDMNYAAFHKAPTWSRLTKMD